MPGLNVLDNDGDLQTFPDAEVWHVDDRGQLHLKRGQAPVASFARDRWQAVAVADTLTVQSRFEASIQRMSAAIEEMGKHVRDTEDAVGRGARAGTRKGIEAVRRDAR